MIYAVIPAAGKSERMGQPKLALPLGGRTVLERVLAAVKAGGIDETVVVLGAHVAALAAIVQTAGAHALILPEDTPDMKTTVQRGLAWIAERFHPGATDAWLLVPADHPILDPKVIGELLRARTTATTASIWIPTYQGRRGHPTLISWSHTAAMQGIEAGKGLNHYFRERLDAIQEVAVASAEILIDLDTPEDYQRLLASWG